jgi:hypothetical protein
MKCVPWDVVKTCMIDADVQKFVKMVYHDWNVTKVAFGIAKDSKPYTITETTTSTSALGPPILKRPITVAVKKSEVYKMIGSGVGNYTSDGQKTNKFIFFKRHWLQYRDLCDADILKSIRDDILSEVNAANLSDNQLQIKISHNYWLYCKKNAPVPGFDQLYSRVTEDYNVYINSELEIINRSNGESADDNSSSLYAPTPKSVRLRRFVD